MKEGTLIILLIFSLAFNIYNVCFVEYNLSKPMKCDVDKRSKFVEECINKIDLIHKPELVDATAIIKQCEETSKNLYCTY
jgi:hypothetical protein